ncbi:MAG TPA: S-methyl-5-thioribose-1-phosphate isomerase [Rhodothermales bacterium]|nr:S-methyl-5-thioribose-1-phosphate isomerase [Rhodothermales bacterium]
MIVPLRWNEEARRVDLLDQTRLPVEEVWLPIETPDQMAEAIRSLRVRGAPAIGIAASYGVVLALKGAEGDPPQAALRTIDLLAGTRPTAVNLFWALERMRRVVLKSAGLDGEQLKLRLLSEARAIEAEDRAAGIKLGENGLSLLQDGMTILTHCHTGGVATSGYGTALAPLLLSGERGLHLRAYVDETRPLLQGSRITAWELTRSGVPATLITDSMAGHVMQRGLVDAVFVGADRIAANGDTANKIGTYSLAVLAHAHEVPFYVSAPVSTIDLGTTTGADIVIEERNPREVTHGFGRQTAPDEVAVYNPAFDVTPARLITAIITEKGVIRPPYDERLPEVAQASEAGKHARHPRTG